MNEIWKDVKGYEGLYKISNNGRVFSFHHNKNGRELTYSLSNSGYYLVGLYDGKQKRVYIHRLVAEHFIPNPNNLPQVNHKDENKLNNEAVNLEWVTRKQNINYGKGIEKKTLSQSMPVVGTNIETGIEIRFASTSEAQKNGFNSGNISLCCRGERKQHKGYIWEYAEPFAKPVEELEG